MTEALDPRQELYSEKRLRDFMNSGVLTDRPLAEQLRLLHADIEAFAAGAEQADDITMLLLQIKQITGGRNMAELTIDATLENLDTVLDFVNQQMEQ